MLKKKWGLVNGILGGEMYKIASLFLFLVQISGLQANYEYNSLFESKNILITGGAGFIGRALVDEILKYNPAKIVIFSRDEVKHYRMMEQLKGAPLESIIGDIRDYDAIYRATKGIDIVIHAAALKRIDILEYHVNESVNTNILGSINVIKACTENNIEKALLVSSDKACAPINAYGACKFISEKLFNNFAPQKSQTTFLVVRYGNVLQSTGSVIPFFCEKIRNNEVIPLTNEYMTRFFITKQQAVELIFKALLYGKGGEVFIPSLPAFKIVDLIAVLQEKLGNTTDIEIVGLRPGEKIHEAMINSTEVPRTYKFQNMFIIVPTVELNNQDAVYKNELLSTDIMDEYVSNQEVLSQKDLKEILEKYRIIL